MPDVLTTDASTQAQKDAVSLLMYHVGVAAEMDYGCGDEGSSSSAWADEILDLYFGYKSSMQFYDRASIATAAQWFALFKAELDADPPRPVILSILSNGGHEVVVDGYQSDFLLGDLVHINFGWGGDSDDFTTSARTSMPEATPGMPTPK